MGIGCYPFSGASHSTGHYMKQGLESALTSHPKLQESPYWASAQQQSQKLAVLAKDKAQLDKELAVACAKLQAFRLDQQQASEMLSELRPRLNAPEPVGLASLHAKHPTLWVHYYLDWSAGRGKKSSHERTFTHKTWLQSIGADEFLNTASTKQTSTMTAKIAQAVTKAAVERLQDRYSAEAYDAAYTAVTRLERQVQELHEQQEEAHTQLQEAFSMLLQGAFAPVHPGPDVKSLQQELDATQAQLAAAVVDAGGKKAMWAAAIKALVETDARAAKAEAALQLLQQQPPITLTVSVVQPSVSLQITIQQPAKPRAQQQPAQQQEASSVKAVPQQPAEPKQVAAQEVEKVQPQAPELQQMARSTAAVEAELARTQQQQQVKAAGSPAAAPAAQRDEQGAVKEPVTPPAAAGSPVNPLSPRESVTDSDTAASSSILGALWGQITDAVAAVSASSVRMSAFSWTVDTEVADKAWVAGVW